MLKHLDHWLIEDDEREFTLPESEVEDFDYNEFNPKEFESYDDTHNYEMLIP